MFVTATKNAFNHLSVLMQLKQKKLSILLSFFIYLAPGAKRHTGQRKCHN